jgi:glycosyltransferase involved in cell wall biosynthesis
MNKQLIDQYNQANSLIVISSYPRRNQTYGKGIDAVSSFTKNTLSGIKEQNPSKKIIIVSMEFNKEEIYEENGMLIIRCFERNNPLTYLNIIKYALKFNKIKAILLEFEFASYGNTFATAMLAPLAWVLKLIGKDITMVIHQVLLDLKQLSGHIGISEGHPKTKLLNFGLKWFYKVLAIPARDIIVLEDEFKQRLEQLVGEGKITVIPHGVDFNIKNSNYKRKKIEQKLGIQNNDFVILYFGYLTWYKGADFIIDALGETRTLNGKNIKLLIAGGPSFTQQEKVHYQQFLSTVYEKVSKSNNTILTGFVDEKDITPIFNASDLVVFPYRTFMSASGPLSLALSHKKPFIISNKLSEFLESKDVKESMVHAGITKDNLLFELNTKSLLKTIRKASTTKTYKKMVEFSKTLGQERSFTRLGLAYEEILVTDSGLVFKPALSRLV